MVSCIRIALIFRNEYHYLPYSGRAVSIATTGCLGNGVEGSQSPQHEWEINIDSGFNTLGGYESAWLSIIKPSPYIVKNCLPMGRAHVGREVKNGFASQIDQLIKEPESVSFEVHNASYLFARHHHFCNFCPG